MDAKNIVNRSNGFNVDRMEIAFNWSLTNLNRWQLKNMSLNFNLTKNPLQI